ncbi:MAG: four helix bundle protein [Bacteroidota bacterium]
MEKADLTERTKRFSIRIVNLTVYLADTYTAKMISHQILRSGTSVGANYRAACRSKSRRDFINKLKVVEEETDETLFWLELIEACNLLKVDKVEWLKKESNELLSIFVSSLKTARKNGLKSKGQQKDEKYE